VGRYWGVKQKLMADITRADATFTIFTSTFSMHRKGEPDKCVDWEPDFTMVHGVMTTATAIHKMLVLGDSPRSKKIAQYHEWM
jgi:hypothetical protein